MSKGRPPTRPAPASLIRSVRVLLLAGLAGLVWAASEPDILPNSRTLELVRERYGVQASERVQRWRQFMERDLFGLHEQARLEKVNRFFNAIPGKEDRAVWGQRDYWATPVEFLARYGGDCEDYALAKFFTLRATGVAADRLRITYVRAWIAEEQRVESHMVLAYYPYADADPLILDNINPRIMTASERSDLTPTLGFNAEGLWNARQRGQSGRVGEATSIEHWNRLLARMRQEQ